MIQYGATIRWTSPKGFTEKVSVTGYKTYEEAWAKAFELAVAAGWTQPRWWQYWRWDDRDYVKDYIKEVGSAQVGQLDHWEV